MDAVTIQLETPAQPLMPNVSSHRMAKARATKEARHAAKDAACVAVGTDIAEVKASGFPWSHVTAAVVWKHERIQPDRDNALAALKSSFDGLVDAGIMADDREVIHLPVRMVKVLPGCGGVEITVAKIKGDNCPTCGKAIT